MIHTLRTAVLLVAMTAATVAIVSAQTEGIDWEIGLGPSYIDNFFQAPDSAEQENVSVLMAQLDLRGGVSKKRPLDAYGQVRYLDYNKDLSSSSQFVAGLRHDGNHSFDASWQHYDNRPTVSVGDEFDRVDGDRLNLDYSYRLSRAWEVSAEGLVGQEDFELSPLKESDLWRLGAAVRYRGFGSEFSPELGAVVGERDVVDPNENYDQVDYFLKLRFVPLRPLYLSLGFRFRTRDYSISDSLAGNFDRRDERWRAALTGAYVIRRHWVVNLYATYLDADSTKPSRVFTSSLTSVWLSYRF